MTSLTITANTDTKLLAPSLDYILLDGSGSMSEKWWETLTSLQGFLTILHNADLHTHGIVHVFDSQHLESVQRNDLIKQWEALTGEKPLKLYGGLTPLYDAINLMGRRLAAMKPSRCSIIIVTDGLENGSKHTSAAQARAILDWCRAKGWQVTFLGADFDNTAQAKLLGANERNSLAIRKEKLIDAGEVLGKKRVANAQSGADITFSDDEKENFGGYLTHSIPDIRGA